jgi:hypothetical protein
LVLVLRVCGEMSLWHSKLSQRAFDPRGILLKTHELTAVLQVKDLQGGKRVQNRRQSRYVDLQFPLGALHLWRGVQHEGIELTMADVCENPVRKVDFERLKVGAEFQDVCNLLGV